MVHEVVVGVLLRDDAVLLGHRSPSRRWYPDVWDLPGGHVEPGETALEALARELREELGIEAVVGKDPLFRIDDGDLRLSAHPVTAWSGEPTNAAPDEHDELRFVAADELPRLDLAHPRYAILLAQAIRATR